MAASEEFYANRIFLNCVLPLLKVIAENDEGLAKPFKGRNAVVQFSELGAEGMIGMHFEIQDGSWRVTKGTVEKPDLEFEFGSVSHLNGFFSNKSKKLPKIHGLMKLGLLVGVMKVLLKMSKLLNSKTPPEKPEDRELLVKLFFYLLSSGISQLNKAGHPTVSEWAKKSPDRVFAWAVKDKPELSAYLRAKAGNTKSARGQYTYSKPFFTMYFDSIESALGILLQTDDMIEATINERIIMLGAPEYGVQMGEFMTLVGSLVK